MAVKIRLTRAGAKKRPYYKIIVADSRSPRDGRFIENIGNYNPLLPKDDENRVNLKKDRVEYWLSVGAMPTEKVVTFLNAAKIGQDTNAVKEVNKKHKNTVELKKEEIAARKKAEAEKAAAEAKEKEEAEKAAKAEEEAAAKEAEAAKAEEEAAEEAKDKEAEAPVEEKTEEISEEKN